jgi:hypothetical protein
MENLRSYQSGSGQRQSPLFVWLPTGYQHSYYYYFRNVGWSMHDEWNDQGLIAALDDADSQMAVLMPQLDYGLFLRRNGRSETQVSSRRLSSAILLLPGPLSGCRLR